MSEKEVPSSGNTNDASVSATVTVDRSSFERVGAAGGAQATVGGKSAAMKHFVVFLTKQYETAEVDDIPEEEVCSVDCFQRFAGYLVHAAEDSKGNSLASKTCNQYLSGVKNFLKEKYPRNPIFESADYPNSWYSKIRQDVEKRKGREAFDSGDPIVEKAKPIGRDLML